MALRLSRLSEPLAFLMPLNLFAVTDRMVFGALAPALQASLRLDDVGLAMVQGPAFGVPYALALPFAGWLVDAVGLRRVLVGSVLVWTAGLLVSASAGSLAMLVAGRGITAVGQSALTPAAFALIVRLAPPGTAGRSLALFTSAGAVGRSFAFVAGGAFLAVFAGSGVEPWSGTLAMLAVITLLLLIVGGRRIPAEPRAAARAGNYPMLWRWLRDHRTDVALAVTAALGTVVIAQALAAWIAVILVRTQGTAPAAAAVAIGVVGLIAGPGGQFLGGALADGAVLRGRGQPLAMLLCIPAVLAFVAAPSLVVALIALAATLILSGVGGAVGLVRVQRLIPDAVRGSANGLFMMLVALVGISGGPLLVPILGGAGGGVGGGLVLLVGLAAGLSAVAVMLGDRRPAVVAA